ncbi:MAG: SNF2 family DNA or RNA helicase [Saprospiraceae bacterium]|jgi:SNF2 family DNA or RNA helicase
MILSNTTLTEYFSRNETIRGKRYFQQNHVQAVEIKAIEFGWFSIASAVKGTRARPYDQEIELFIAGEGENTFVADVVGNCSCYVGFNCKHVLAALYACEKGLMTEMGISVSAGENQSVSTDIFSWIDNNAANLKGFQVIEASVPAAQSALLVYELHLDGTRHVVRCEKTRRLKSGELSTAASSRVDPFNVYGSEGYLGANDKEMLSMLSVSDRTARSFSASAYSGAMLSGHVGATVLELLAKSGRLYLGDYRSKQSLSLGEPRLTELSWKMNEAGEQNLSLLEQGTVDELIEVQPVMALEKSTGELFPISDESDFLHLVRLQQVPMISAEQSLRIGAEAKQKLLSSGLPIPLSVQLEDITDTAKLTPILEIGLALSAKGEYCQEAYAMSLEFAYGVMPPILAAQEPDYILHNSDGHITRCKRDQGAEQQHELALREGFNIISLVDYLPANLPASLAGHSISNAVPAPHYWGFTAVVDWYDFLEQRVPELEALGWIVKVNENFQLSFLEADEEDWYTDIDDRSNSNWFDLELGVQIDSGRVNLLPVLLDSFKSANFTKALETLRQAPEAKKAIDIGDGKLVLFPNQKLIPLLEVFVELFDSDTVLDKGKLRLSVAETARLSIIAGEEWQWHGGEALRNLAQRLNDFSGIEQVTVPDSFKGELRDYQQQGVNWLQFLGEFKFNGILSDDMGLGKTVQTLAHLCCEKQQGRLANTSLIVAPTSLMSNWRNEITKFAADLSVIVLQGSDRKQWYGQIDSVDIVLTTYQLVVRDADVLMKHSYSYLILDESQRIKNPKSKSAQQLRKLRAQHRLCLTGTPLENHLGELWAQFDFLMPGFLGNEKTFNKHYRTPIEKQGDVERTAALQRRIGPMLLRRTKDLVASELPKKTEITRTVPLLGAQRDLYETIRLMMHDKVRGEIAKRGMNRSQILILDALLKLRQVCCHPDLVKLEAARKVKTSAKLDLLMEMLSELVNERRRILVFSQFTSMLAVIEAQLKDADIGYTKLTGQTKNREAVIDQFQQGDVPVFLISLKAGGIGLNLTAADTVIHYDPWWNPAVEDQATDRAHRIGQDKPVFVYKLITEETVESKIVELQERKRQLAKRAYGQVEKKNLALTETDLEELFKPLVTTPVVS